MKISHDEIIDAAYYIHSQRSKKAREVDEGETAKLANNIFTWAADPSRHDFDHIDTIDHRKPKGYTRSKGKKAYDALEEITSVEF
jgi:hypothetical protein